MLLSIIIPVYNVDAYLPQCLDSVLQVYKAGINAYGKEWMSLVCIDDGSTDASWDILQKFESQHPFVIIESVPNGGAGYARNIGMQKAKGDFIYFLDSDDFILPEAFLEAFQSIGPQIDIVCCNANYGEYGPLLKSCSFSTNSGGEFCEKLFTLANIYYPCQLWVYFYRRAFLESHHILFPEGIVCEDEEFTWIALSYAHKSIKRESIIVYHRQNRFGSVMYDVSEKHIHSLLTVSRHLFDNIENIDEVCSSLRHALFALFVQVLSLCKKKGVPYTTFFEQKDQEALKILSSCALEKRTYKLSKVSLNIALAYYTYTINPLFRKIINLFLISTK